MDALLEQTFCLDPFASFKDVIFEEFDPESYFVTEDGYMDEIFNEAAGTKKKNIIQRLGSIIKKVIKWIIKKIGQIVGGIKKLIRGKTKTANQIAKEAGLKRHEIKRDAPDPNDPNTPGDAANSMYINFIEGITEDGILIKPSALIKIDPEKDVPIKGKKIHGAGVRASQVLDLILNPKIVDEYLSFFKQLVGEFDNKELTEKDFEKINELCKSFSGRPSKLAYVKDEVVPSVRSEHELVRITVKQLTDFQKKVDEMCEVCEKVDDCFTKLNVNFEDNSAKTERYYIDILNDLSWSCVNLQGGLHAISNGLAGIYHIDPGYYSCIETPEMLAKFVELSMKYGIPGKYFVNNIYRACHKKIKGNPNVNNPLMGFGRLTLIPQGDIIYKIAINEYGVRSNKNDFIVMKEVKGTPLMARFAETTKTYNYFVNVMEKVKAGSAHEPGAIEAAKIGKEINDELEKAGVGFSIYDIKSDAFGQKDGKYVILDYGYLHRRKFESQKEKTS